MTKLSNKIRIELEVLAWFIPSWTASPTVTQADREAFAAWSSRGTTLPRTPGTDILKLAKTYREYSISMWREDIQNGLITLQELYFDMPVVVQRYVSRSIGVMV
jgi:hypothetical protein